ncbi:MAG: biotin-dependent carboxyltransferase family protein [Candidatus Nanopelagicales bacterium]
MIEVVAPGPLALVEDLGRPGRAAIGVARSGAFDRGSLRLANRLVGNDEGAAGIETLAGGLALRATVPLVVAVTGADGPVSARGPAGAVRQLPRRSPLHLAAGDVLELGAPSTGLRSYVAVRGGLAVPRTLGSASFDTMSGLGPAPLAVGDRLPLGSAVLGAPHVDHAPARPAAPALRVLPGPRDDWFGEAGLAALAGTAWAVSPASDRVGVRLDGDPLGRTRSDELPSEPMVPGALQVPPDGRPVLLGPDGPTTGGYPVIGVVVDADLDRVAQLRPGELLRLTIVR